MIVSDHGFFKVEKVFRPETFLESMGLAGSDAKPWRVAVRVSGGSAAFVLRDPDDREAEATVSRMLRQLQQDGGYGIDRILDKAELASLHSWPDAFVAINMKEGWATAGGRTGAWVAESGSTKGTHGYLPGPEALDATFVVFGPGIPAQRVPRGRLIDVAPTASHLLGIKLGDLPGADLLGARAVSRR